MACVLWEEFSGNDRRNQSGKRLKVRTWDLSFNLFMEASSRKVERFYQKAWGVSSYKHTMTKAGKKCKWL
jgi:hypothetical protein